MEVEVNELDADDAHSEACQRSPRSAERDAETELIRASDRASKRKWGLIYKITLRATGEGYIGLTSQTFRKRMQGHYSKAMGGKVEKGCKKLHAKILAHGWEAFEKKCLYARVPKPVLGAMERVMIGLHHTRSGPGGTGGMNLTDGGDQGGFADPEVQRRAQEKAKPAQAIVFASAEFKAKVGKESKKQWDNLTPAEHQAKAQKQTNGRHAEFVRRREAKIATLPYEQGKYYWERQKRTCLGRIRRRMAKEPERFIGLDPIGDCEQWFGPSFEERRKE